MDDPANFGMDKSMFTAQRPDGGGPIFDLGALLESGIDPGSDQFQAVFDRTIAEFNALPFDERKALTDPSFSGAVPPVRRIRIPVVDVPPTEDELATGIAESRLLTMIDGLVEHIGTGGIAVTQAGNLRLADARTLVAQLGTGDDVEHHFPWNDEPEPIRSSTECPASPWRSTSPRPPARSIA